MPNLFWTKFYHLAKSYQDKFDHNITRKENSCFIDSSQTQQHSSLCDAHRPACNHCNSVHLVFNQWDIPILNLFTCSALKTELQAHYSGECNGLWVCRSDIFSPTFLICWPILMLNVGTCRALKTDVQANNTRGCNAFWTYRELVDLLFFIHHRHRSHGPKKVVVEVTWCGYTSRSTDRSMFFVVFFCKKIK